MFVVVTAIRWLELVCTVHCHAAQYGVWLFLRGKYPVTVTSPASHSDWFYSVQRAQRSGKQPGRCSMVNVQLGSSESFHYTEHYIMTTTTTTSHHWAGRRSQWMLRTRRRITRTQASIALAAMTLDWSLIVLRNSKVVLSSYSDQISCCPDLLGAGWFNISLSFRPAAGCRAGKHSAGEEQRPGVHHQTSAGSHRGPDTGDRGRQS